MTAGASLGALIGVVLVGMVGCDTDGGEGGMDTADATARLEAQRDDVRGAAGSLLAAAEKGLPGATVRSGGTYRGCESAFAEEFTSFRYLVQARIDVDAAAGVAPPYVAAMRSVLEEVGFTAGDHHELPNGFVTVTGAQADVRATFTHTGAGAFVALTVAGPCIDVPEDDRDDWLTRKEPTPGIL